MLLDQQHQSDVSPITPMPCDRVDDTSTVNTASAETITWLFEDSDVWASATGEAAGTLCYAKLNYTGVTNSGGSSIGSKNDTSLSFAAATRAATLVQIPESVFSKMEGMSVPDKITLIGPYLDEAGEYAIDHRRGAIWLNSLDTVADDSVTYKYQTPLSGGGAGDKVDVIKLGGAAINTDGGNRDAGTQTVTLADDDPAVTSLGTLDGAIATDDSAQDATPSIMNTGGEYRAAEDTYADGDAVIDHYDINGNKKVVDKAYDSLTQANKVAEVNPLNQQYVGETLLALTNIAQTTTGYGYIDMSGVKYLGIQAETSGTAPTDVLTVTLEATLQDDGTAAASCVYQDVTNTLTGSASFVDTDFMALMDTPLPVKYLRVKYVTSTGGGNDCDLTVYTKKLY